MIADHAALLAKVRRLLQAMVPAAEGHHGASPTRRPCIDRRSLSHANSPEGQARSQIASQQAEINRNAHTQFTYESDLRSVAGLLAAQVGQQGDVFTYESDLRSVAGGER